MGPAGNASTALPMRRSSIRPANNAVAHGMCVAETVLPSLGYLRRRLIGSVCAGTHHPAYHMAQGRCRDPTRRLRGRAPHERRGVRIGVRTGFGEGSCRLRRHDISTWLRLRVTGAQACGQHPAAAIRMRLDGLQAGAISRTGVLACPDKTDSASRHAADLRTSAPARPRNALSLRPGRPRKAGIGSWPRRGRIHVMTPATCVHPDGDRAPPSIERFGARIPHRRVEKADR